ncbi:MAG: M16 family metallopeptidase [Bacteroidales bacterium]
MKYFRYTLANGLQILLQKVTSPVAHVGVFIRSGTVNEPPHLQGLAHFTEHALFKGSQRRNSYEILSSIESVGGEMNAYTSKEETCYYASFLKEYLSDALDVFSDMLFNPVFPEEEIVKEKQVVLDEVESYQDNPAEQIFDDFETLLFGKHPLGRQILGKRKDVMAITREDLISYVSSNYQPSRMLISCVGDFEPESLIRLAEKFFGHRLEYAPLQVALPRPRKKKPFHTTRKKANHQAHVVTGLLTEGPQEKSYYPLNLLNLYIGGPLMMSRLNLSVREKYGLTYIIESNLNYYSTTGLFTIYFGTDTAQVEKVLSIIREEINRLRDKALTAAELETLKRQYTGLAAIGWEVNQSRMLGAGKKTILGGYAETFDEMKENIHRITAEELQETAIRLLDPEHFSTLIFTP